VERWRVLSVDLTAVARKGALASNKAADRIFGSVTTGHKSLYRWPTLAWHNRRVANLFPAAGGKQT
jgi:hypothetical protein